MSRIVVVVVTVVVSLPYFKNGAAEWLARYIMHGPGEVENRPIRITRVQICYFWGCRTVKRPFYMVVCRRGMSPFGFGRLFIHYSSPS